MNEISFINLYQYNINRELDLEYEIYYTIAFEENFIGVYYGQYLNLYQCFLFKHTTIRDLCEIFTVSFFYFQMS